eukprot:jgi/Astpho2/6382/e_gw1.00091.50.1_t
MGTAKPGYTLITPLYSPEWGKWALVNQGWVPAQWRDDPSWRRSQEPRGECWQLTAHRLTSCSFLNTTCDNQQEQQLGSKGLVLAERVLSTTQPGNLPAVVRHSEPRSGFVPDNKPAEGEWYWIDAPGIAQSLQLPPDTPLVEPVTKQEQYPSPRGVQDLMGFSVNPDDHRNYALTWYTLAAATALLANRAMRQRPVIVKRHR